MKVLHISQGYKGSRIYKNLFAELEKKGVDNIVYLPQHEDLGDNISQNIVVSENNYSKLQRFIFFGKQLRSLREVERRVNLQNIDLVHAHNMFSGGYIAYLINKKHNIPYVVSIRNTDVNTFYKYMVHLRQLGIYILRRAKFIVFISPSYKKHVLSRWFDKKNMNEFEKKSVVIANGLEQFFYEQTPEEKKVEINKQIRLIYYGEISKNKNIETTMRACHTLIEEGYNVHFQIIGNVKYRGFYKLLDKNNFVEFKDYCTQQELISFIREADIFVMPSIYETFGLVYIEAMSQGLPIIYSKNQGFDGFFSQGEVGFAIESKDSVAIVEAIKDIYADYNNISQRALKNYNKFNWSCLANKYWKVYKNAIIKNNLS